MTTIVTEFFRTDRLIFRPFEDSDLAGLARIVADPEVMQFVGDGVPMNATAAATWIVNSRSNVMRFGYGTGAVVDQASGRLVGWTGLARTENNLEEIIYGFEKAAWCKGFGTEILRALVVFAFSHLDLCELRATIYSQNAASERILSKCGFEFVSIDDDGSRNYLLNRP